VEMEVGEEEVRDLISTFFVCCTIPFMYYPLGNGIPLPSQETRFGPRWAVPNRKSATRHENVIDSQTRTLLARPSGRLRRI
jgi:hypothetical protein